MFQSIKSGNLIFPEKHWSRVSSDAKDLITKLLVRDASQRLDANSILNHPWIIKHKTSQQLQGTKESSVSSTNLETPRVLRSRNNTKEMMFSSGFASSALAIKRNCGGNPQTNAVLKQPMKKSATVSEFFEGNNESVLDRKDSSLETVDRSLPIAVSQTNNNKHLATFVGSSPSGIDEKPTCDNFNDSTNPNDIKGSNNFSQELGNQLPKLANRKQSCQDYLAYPRPFSKLMKRQTSLVIFANDYEKDMNEIGCRWEF